MSDAPAAVIVDDPGLEPANRLAVAVERCGTWAALEALVDESGLAPAVLPIVIVPELGGFVADSPSATDPKLVEGLVDLFGDAGYFNVAIGGSADESATWAANRDIYAIAELLGYSFVSAEGRDYDFVDFADDTVPGPFRPGEVLSDTPLGRVWLDAAFRVVFAKNRTHEVDGYSLGLGTVIKVLPPTDDHYHYRLAADSGDVLAELVRATPVHLTLIDAVVSCHGSGGTRAPKSITTDCVIAANDIWLADAVGATKMGLDPGVSTLTTRSPHRDGLGDLVVQGSLTPYTGWTNPHPLIMDSSRKRDASPWWSRLVRPWLQVLDPDLFSLEYPVDSRMNERLAPMFNDVDADPLAFAGLVYLNYTMASLQEWLDGYRVLFDKDALRRVKAPLAFDADGYKPDAYRAIVPELDALERMLEGAPERAPGLHWRYVNDAVLFEYRRELPIDFDVFVAAIEVSRTISYMNDYIGGVVLPLDHDDSNRPIRQAERNLYLPQPNYLVLSGGQPIDVGKLEVIEYEENMHRMYWKTIESDNGSAIHDDGIVTFARTDKGTTVTIFGRQLFVLPPLWNAIDLGLSPELKAHLVTDAYRTFFDRTLANFEALVEGRDIQIGRPWLEPDETPEARPAVAVEQLAEEALDWAHTLSDRVRRPERHTAESAEQVKIDADGFTHFRAASRPEPPVATTPMLADIAAFWTGLFEAGLRDLRNAPGSAPR